MGHGCHVLLLVNGGVVVLGVRMMRRGQDGLLEPMGLNGRLLGDDVDAVRVGSVGGGSAGSLQFKIEFRIVIGNAQTASAVGRLAGHGRRGRSHLGIVVEARLGDDETGWGHLGELGALAAVAVEVVDRVAELVVLENGMETVKANVAALVSGALEGK